jgi:hypothetical protein
LAEEIDEQLQKGLWGFLTERLPDTHVEKPVFEKSVAGRGYIASRNNPFFKALQQHA